MITARGIGLAVAGVALAVAGHRFGYAEAVTVGVAALIACAIGLLTVMFKPRLAVDRSAQPDRVTRGDRCTVTLVVHNRGRFRAVSMLAADRCGSRRVAVPVARLRPGRTAELHYPAPTERRGVLRLGPLTAARRDLLGVARTSGRYGGTGQVWVHPVAHPLHRSPLGVARSMDGTVDRIEQGSLTFHALREYVMGDDLRHVHWRTSARIGELMVREHLDTSLPSIVVLLDDRAGAYRGDGFETACEAAASVILACLREGFAVTLAQISGTIVADSGRDDYFDALAEADPVDPPAATDTPGGDPMLDRAVARLKQQRLGDTLFFITGTARKPPVAHLALLRGGYPAMAVVTCGADHAGPGSMAGIPVLGAATGGQFAAAWDEAGDQ